IGGRTDAAASRGDDRRDLSPQAGLGPRIYCELESVRTADGAVWVWLARVGKDLWAWGHAVVGGVRGPGAWGGGGSGGQWDARGAEARPADPAVRHGAVRGLGIRRGAIGGNGRNGLTGRITRDGAVRRWRRGAG